MVVLFLETGYLWKDWLFCGAAVMGMMEHKLGLGPADLSFLWNIQVTVFHFGYFSGAQGRGLGQSNKLKSHQHLDG